MNCRAKLIEDEDAHREQVAEDQLRWETDCQACYLGVCETCVNEEYEGYEGKLIEDEVP
jgi:hypothetical protein